MGNLRTRSHQAKFPICEKELKKCLETGVVLHCFNPGTGKAEAGGALSLRPAWSAERVPEQPDLSSEGNHREQEVGEDVIGPWSSPNKQRTLANLAMKSPEIEYRNQGSGPGIKKYRVVSPNTF